MEHYFFSYVSFFSNLVLLFRFLPGCFFPPRLLLGHRPFTASPSLWSRNVLAHKPCATAPCRGAAIARPLWRRGEKAWKSWKVSFFILFPYRSHRSFKQGLVGTETIISKINRWPVFLLGKSVFVAKKPFGSVRNHTLQILMYYQSWRAF